MASKQEEKNSGFGDKDEIDLLMRKYLALRTEIIEYVRLYRAHANYLTAILASIVALISFASKSDSGTPLFDSYWFLFYVAIAITTIVSYLVFNALEAQYAMFATAGRAASLENRINSLARRSLLIWESELSDQYWWASKQPRSWWGSAKYLKGIGFPSEFLISYMGMIVFQALFSTPAYLGWILFAKASGKVGGNGCWLFGISLLYSAASFALIVYVSGTVLRRMKERARNLATEVAESARRRSEEYPAEMH